MVKSKLNLVKLVAFDLDGTILNDDRVISDSDRNTLEQLALKGVLRIAATGRNLLSLKRVLQPDFPIDYAVFSSGAGVINWKTKEVLVEHNITHELLQKVLKLLNDNKLSFTVNAPIPNSHKMLLHIQDDDSCDLKNYTSYYKDYTSFFDFSSIPESASQVIALLNHKRFIYDNLKRQLPELKCILTTSPINQKSLWIEIFNKKVSKAYGVEWIMDQHNIQLSETFSIGNDFNDIDLLKFTHRSFVVSNANTELLQQFEQTLSNNESGFTAAIKKVIDV